MWPFTIWTRDDNRALYIVHVIWRKFYNITKGFITSYIETKRFFLGYEENIYFKYKILEELRFQQDSLGQGYLRKRNVLKSNDTLIFIGSVYCWSRPRPDSLMGHRQSNLYRPFNEEVHMLITFPVLEGIEVIQLISPRDFMFDNIVWVVPLREYLQIYKDFLDQPVKFR